MHYNVKSILYNYGFDDENENGTIYMSLYKALVKAIRNRKLVEHTKLPPTRVLAKDLHVSRSTVLKAYELLVLERYVYATPGSGYFVTATRNKKMRTYLNTMAELGDYPKISKRGRSFRRNLQNFNKTKNQGVAFRPGLPPLDVFPVQQWKQLTNDYWKGIKSSELSYSNTIGLECLRANISNYLKIYRNIDCQPEQIIITTGSLHSLNLIANTLIDKNDQVVLENPTYPYARALFDSFKASICSAAIDAEGISVMAMDDVAPKLVYTTPSNQYPSGVKMSMKRRWELLKWASKKNTFIIEDDYDHEFSNWEEPLSSIYSLDQQERTIYLGTFNKLLHPSLRVGYMIAPYYLLDTLKAICQQSTRFVSPSLQKTLSAFIEKDYLNKHLRNVIEASVRRKNMFMDFFEDRLAAHFTLQSMPLGLHIIAESKLNIHDTKIAGMLAQKNVVAHPYSNYFIGNTTRTGLVMGYASVNEKVMKRKIDLIQRQLQVFKEPRGA